MRQSFRGLSASVSTPRAEQRDRHGFIDKPRWLGRKLVAIELDQRKRIVGIVDRGCQQRVGAFAHEARIGTVEQDDGAARIGPGEKSVDFFSAKRDQDQVPATKNDASRVWIFSAISWAARSSASRNARVRAKRWIEPGMSYDTREKVEPVMTDLFEVSSIRLYC